ncbi:TAP42 family protein [Babesia ovis]|uniref:TAP42 family protein n=1 Tax=Babesia ovis TaxID=5869 RepID=A0A9W5TEZ8_BABOV|nr:TAP42 family protein [Babesia ovis]
MGCVGDGSDLEVLERLFEKAFGQYWMMQWCHQGYDKFRPFPSELSAAMVLWQDRVPALDEEQVGYALDTEGGSTSSSGSSMEAERQHKLRALGQLEVAFQLIMVGCDALDIISRNDDLSDIHTDALKYLMLPYLAAHVAIQKPEMKHRAIMLRRGLVYLTEFMNTLSGLKLLLEREDLYWNRNVTDVPSERRNFRVESTKWSVQLLGDLRPILNSAESVEQFLRCANADAVDEEAARSQMISLLHLFSCDAISLYDMIQMEIPMLERYMSEAKSGKKEDNQDHKSNSMRKPWTIYVDGVSKLDPTTAHFLYKRLIFVPGHNLPEISLDECARIEMEMDVKTIGTKTQEKRAKSPRSECSGDSEASDSDYTSDSRDDDEVAKEKAKWDDWKDDHPKGSGNKNRNVG